MWYAGRCVSGAGRCVGEGGTAPPVGKGICGSRGKNVKKVCGVIMWCVNDRSGKRKCE